MAGFLERVFQCVQRLIVIINSQIFVLTIKNIKNTNQSGYGVLTALLILLTAALILLEFGTDFIERMGGRMMSWNNYRRPRAGRTWEYQASSAAAMQKLEQVISDREEIRRELRTREDLLRLREQLAGGKILTLSREKFLDLYHSLPRIYAQVFGSQAKLLEYSAVMGWSRVALSGGEGFVDVYYVNSDNFTVGWTRLDQDFFRGLERWGMEISGPLELNTEFSGRTFSPAEFAAALAELDIGWENLPGGEELLRNGDALVRIGVSRRWMERMVDIGFQFKDGRTLIYQAEDTFALELLMQMQEIRSGAPPGMRVIPRDG